MWIFFIFGSAMQLIQTISQNFFSFRESMPQKKGYLEKFCIDLFTFSLTYNQPESGVNPLYNGNISSTSWSTANVDSGIKRYTYSYDALNRITSGKYTSTSHTNRYNLNAISYDKNGNILQLSRNGHTNAEASSFGVMDNLSYSYDAGNKLQSVTDASGIEQGFKDGNTVGDDYSYDANGNLTVDKNKNITSIKYNHLNLPIEVAFDNSDTKKINYIYDAGGMKLRKVVNDNSNITTTDYAGNHIYENDELQFFNTAEGYVKPVIASDSEAITSFEYVYQYKDHLGDIRLSYADSDKNGEIDAATEIIEEKHFYPFGLAIKGMNTIVSSNGNGVAQRFGYNGKELSEDLGLNTMDFGARNYDAALGRWMNLDPLAEMMRRHSPYNYAFNNPIFFIDPDGMLPKASSGAIGGKLMSGGKFTQADVESSSFGRHSISTTNYGAVAAQGGGKQTSQKSNGLLDNPISITTTSSSGLSYTMTTGGNSNSSSSSNNSNLSRISNSLLFTGASREYYIQSAKGLKTIYGNNFELGAKARTSLKAFVRNRMTPYPAKQYLNKFHLNKNPFPKNLTPSFWKTNKWVNFGGRVSGVLGAVGTGYQAYGVWNYYNDPTNSHVVHPGRFAADAFATGLMYYGGPIGFTIGGFYHLGMWATDGLAIKNWTIR